jgi:predicted metal-dependent hydrolase
METDTAPAVELKHSKMLLRVRPGTGEEKRQAIVDEWYRAQLKRAAPALIAKWKPKRGSCNPVSGSIRLNTDLAKKPPECLEYILVHEMVHLIVRHHDDRFTGLMDRNLPGWRLTRQMLNAAPLAHVDWAY